MSHKIIAVSTAIIAVFVTLAILFAEIYAILQNINPVAAIAAAVVVVIGLLWFKRTVK